jgi:ABC-2 type transport system ATP-binding protein
MPVIEVQNLQKRYQNTIAVNNISFTVNLGEIFGIIGPNGAGKTTTVECIQGLRTPDNGSVRVLGLDPQASRDELRQHLGSQLQSSQLPDRIKVWEALDLFSSLYPEPADWRQLIETLGLSEKRNTVYAQLSGGQKQRLSIALALVGNPEVLILDELTTGLDPQARRDIWLLMEGIRARGVTILLVTHLMEEAERLCDRLAMIDSGCIVALDTPARIVSGVLAEQRIYFTPSTPFNDSLLTGLTEVHHVSRTGARVVVAGSGDLVGAVTSALARNRIVANNLRIEQANLDDAFIALTGHKLEDNSTGELQ